MRMTRKRRLFLCPLASQGMNIWISIDTQNRHWDSCQLKFQLALMSMPSSVSSLDSNSLFPVSELFLWQTPGSINIKIFRNHYFKRKTTNCIIFCVFNNTLHSDLFSQIINFPTKMSHSETNYVILRSLPQRHCKREDTFQKAVPVNNVHEIYLLSQYKKKYELSKDFLTQPPKQWLMITSIMGNENS